MARKKGSEEQLDENLSMNDLVSALMADTNFDVSKDTNVLSQRIKVETPLIALNCILGGGVPLGSVDESFGFPKSGKSTWLYQTMGKFQKKYSNGLGVILDNESSADDSRLEFFGVDTSRVLRLPSSSIEAGFLNLLQMLKNKSKSQQAKEMPVFIVWDSISKGLAQDGATQSRMNAQDRARVIKNYMSEILPEVEKHNMILFLINQVVFETDRYGNRKVKSGGGVGLEHDVHFKVKTELSNADEYIGPMLVGRYSKLDIVKSKFSPEFNNIPIYIDIANGGAIDEIRSFVDYLVNLGLIPNLAGYYKIEGTLVPKYKHTPFYEESIKPLWKALRYSALIDIVRANPHMVDCLQLILMDYIGEIYKLQRNVMEDYYTELSEKYAKESSLYEYRIYDTEGVLSDLLDNLVANPEVLEKVREHTSKDSTDPVCMDCGSSLEYHESCPNCKSNKVLSMSSARYVVSKLSESSESTPEDSTDTTNSSEGEISNNTEETNQ